MTAEDDHTLHKLHIHVTDAACLAHAVLLCQQHPSNIHCLRDMNSSVACLIIALNLSQTLTCQVHLLYVSRINAHVWMTLTHPQHVFHVMCINISQTGCQVVQSFVLIFINLLFIFFT